MQKENVRSFRGLVFEGNDDMTDVVIAGCGYQKMAALDQVLFVIQIFSKLTQIKFEA
jgi:hypothetical protein